MKKIYLLLITIAIAVNSQAQTSTSEVTTKRLAYLCKVWGYTKYFHSEVASGEIPWDEHLLTAITETNASTNTEEFNQAIINLLIKAGEMAEPTSSLPVIPDSLMMNLDISWFQDTILNDSVRTILDTINSRFRPQNNYYVTTTSTSPSFQNDIAFNDSEPYPSEGIRLLAMFRFWNAIEYFFPYKYMMDKNWDSVLLDYIPGIQQASNELEYHLAMKEFLININDSHGFMSSTVFSTWDGLDFTPFRLIEIDGQAVISKTIATNPDFSPGDIVLGLDNLTMAEYEDSLLKYVHCSNEAISYRNLYRMVSFGNGGNFEVTIDDGSNIQTITAERGDFTEELYVYTGETWWDTVLEGGCKMGYVHMGNLETSQVATMMEELGDSDGIIFDIRNYPNGTLWTLVNYLYETSLHIANFTVPDAQYPGTFDWESAYIGYGTNEPYQGKVIILFNEDTQSQAEYTCMGLEQHPNSFKIGSQTSGADGNICYMDLPGGIRGYFTGLGTFYPDYTETQRIGIVPDIEVRPSIAGLKEGRDEVLETALDCSLYEMETIIGNHYSANIVVSPNPCTSNITVEIEDEISEDYELQIIDITGKVIYSTHVNNKRIIVNVESLEKGVYKVLIKAPKNIYNSQFIKI